MPRTDLSAKTVEELLCLEVALDLHAEWADGAPGSEYVDDELQAVTAELSRRYNNADPFVF